MTVVNQQETESKTNSRPTTVTGALRLSREAFVGGTVRPVTVKDLNNPETPTPLSDAVASRKTTRPFRPKPKP